MEEEKKEEENNNKKNYTYRLSSLHGGCLLWSIPFQKRIHRVPTIHPKSQASTHIHTGPFPGWARTYTHKPGYITMRNTPIYMLTHSLRLPLQSSFFMINIQRRALAPHPGSCFLEDFGQTSFCHPEYSAIRRFSHTTLLALCTRNCLPASCQPKPQPPPH